VDMVTGWTGRDACALQSALRMSNQVFAVRLGIGLRTVADWHEKPDLRPRPETQQLLDAALAQASAAERERFAALAGQSTSADSASAGEDTAAAADADNSPDPRSVSIGVNAGVISTGEGAVIDARTIHLPAEAIRAPAGVAAAPGLHNLPAPGNPVFVDRLEDLAELDSVMNQQPPASPPVVHGLGGTGKSTLALHFAHRNRERYNPVWWISADSPVSVTSGLAQLAARLDPYANLTAKTSTEAAAWAVGWLQAHDGWLLVLDDADSPRSLESVLGPLAGGRHLITSRRATGWHRVARPLPLALLPPDAALDLLMQVINPGDDSDRTVLERLAAELGYLPLALEQAAAYIEYTAITPAAYLDRLRRYPARMFAASADSDAAGESDRQRTVARIWQLSLQAIADEQPLAGEALRTLAWFSPDPIPRDLAYQLHDDPLTVDDALALLRTYSMITLTPQSITIHRLVQAVARTPDPADPYRTPEAISQGRDHAARLLLESLPENPLWNVPSWPRWRELLPHVQALTDHVGPGQDTPTTASILLAASGYLQGDGHFDQAIASALRAVDAYQQLQGPDTLATLTARSYLASAYRAAGDLAAAAPLHQLNLADSERVLGEDHPETLVARSNLAYLYALQHEEHRAIALNERNLTDYERVHGPDHPHTLNARANLASSYRAAGDLPRAIALHEQSVTDYARVLGDDHSETITARSNLAYAYQLAGDLARAIPPAPASPRRPRTAVRPRSPLHPDSPPAPHHSRAAGIRIRNSGKPAVSNRAPVDHLAVQRLGRGGDRRPGKPLPHPRQAALRALRTGRLVAEQAAQRGGEFFRITGRHEHRGVPGDLGQRAGPAGDERRARSHVLHRRQREPLVHGRDHRDLSGRKNPRILRVRQPAGERDPVAEGQLRHLLPGDGRRGADDDKMHAALGDQLGDRAQQRRKSLERRVSAGHGHDPPGDAQLPGMRAKQPRVNAQRDDMHVPRIDPKITAYITLRGRRHSNQRPRPPCHPPLHPHEPVPPALVQTRKPVPPGEIEPPVHRNRVVDRRDEGDAKPPDAEHAVAKSLVVMHDVEVPRPCPQRAQRPHAERQRLGERPAPHHRHFEHVRPVPQLLASRRAERVVIPVKVKARHFTEHRPFVKLRVRPAGKHLHVMPACREFSAQVAHVNALPARVRFAAVRQQRYAQRTVR